MMLELHEQYPQYEFKQHKGYPTKRHRELLQLFGPCPNHRRSFGPVREAEDRGLGKEG
jgi:ribonuclease HII